MENEDTDFTNLLLALTLASSSLDPYVIQRFIRLFRKRRDLAMDPELEMLIEELAYSKRRFPRDNEDIREIALSVVKGFHESSLEELRLSIEETRKQTVSNTSRLTALSSDLHDFLWLTSTGIDLTKPKLIRYVPINLYVGDPVPPEQKLETLMNSLESLYQLIDLEKADELPSESGSWWKRIWAKTKKALTHQEVTTEIEKARIAVELVYLDKPQAECTSLMTKAAADAIAAIKDIKGPVCLQLGSLLIVKNDGALAAKTLSPLELRKLGENSKMLEKPEEILSWLCPEDTDSGGSCSVETLEETPQKLLE